MNGRQNEKKIRSQTNAYEKVNAHHTILNATFCAALDFFLAQFYRCAQHKYLHTFMCMPIEFGCFSKNSKFLWVFVHIRKSCRITVTSG